MQRLSNGISDENGRKEWPFPFHLFVSRISTQLCWDLHDEQKNYDPKLPIQSTPWTSATTKGLENCRQSRWYQTSRCRYIPCLDKLTRYNISRDYVLHVYPLEFLRENSSFKSTLDSQSLSTKYVISRYYIIICFHSSSMGISNLHSTGFAPVCS